MNVMARNKIVACLLCALLAGGCAANLPPADPQRAERLQQEALQATALKQYEIAFTKLGEAIRYNPQNSQLYLQQAEVLETIQDFAAAAETYQRALDRLPDQHADRELTRYRLGLVQARTGKLRAARKSLARVSDPAMKLDLEGMIITHSDNPQPALALFQQALDSTPDSNRQARIYYHASLAHARLGNVADSKNALFHAVNNARSLALKQHIRILFDQLR